MSYRPYLRVSPAFNLSDKLVSMEKLKNRVREVVVEHLGLDHPSHNAELHDHDCLIADHGADELDLIALAMRLEDEFKVNICDEALRENPSLIRCTTLIADSLTPAQ